MLSKPSKEGNLKTTSPICYPCQLVHGAVHDLINRKADYILLPHIIRIDDSKEAFLNYTCPSTTVMCDIIRASFEGISGKILSPHIGLSKSLIKTSLEEIAEMGSSLDLKKSFCREAGEKALSYYEDYKETYKIKIAEELEKACDKPAIIIAGRPYIACSADVNLALPRKITSRGYNVISIDMLPEMKTSSHQRDVWHFTRQICNAAAHVKQNPNLYICLVSCFSCGPDASIYHYIRQELAGRTFCYLEIDSHTAHAGFETRVGAFIDIIEEKLQREKNNE
jgi:predicted nucleotide-binding protein (sugar kinase/HSP70/actin superfamily)